MHDWFYQHNEFGLCITFKGAALCGVSENTIWQASTRGSKSWKIIDHPEHGKIKLIVWSKMQERYKHKVEKYLRKLNGCQHDDHETCICGDPVNYLAKAPILKMVEADFKAEEFYKAYRYDDDRTLPIQTIRKYTRAASWLKMLAWVGEDKKNRIKKKLNIELSSFYAHVCELIKIEKERGKTDSESNEVVPGDFPATYQRLLKRIELFSAEGYPSLIDDMYGNKVAAKIGKTEYGYDSEVEAQVEALIRKAAGKHNKFDAAQICRHLNIVLKTKGWPEVSIETVRLRMKKFAHLTTAGNSGKRAYNNKIAMQVEREAPKHPLLYWTLDGWTVELLYQDERGFDNRLVMVVVLDAAGKYPVGYAIGDRENTDLIKQATRNALLHVQQIFGEAYRPWQVQSDRFSLKALTPFYQAMAHLHTPAAVGNAKSKIIEPYFNYLNKTYCQFEENWSGFNLSSGNKNQPNSEYLDKIKNSFPDKQSLIAKVIRIMEKERRLKLPAYLAAFNEMPEDAKAILKKEDYLMIFGKKTEDTRKIRASLLQPQIDNIRYSYATFDASFAARLDTDWYTIYDENDMSQVLAVSKDGSIRYLLDRTHRVAMDIYSTTDEDVAYRNKIRNYNKERREEVVQQYITDAELVGEVFSNVQFLDDDSEAALKLMFTHNGQQKERLQDAKKLGQVQRKELAYAQKENKLQEDSWQAQQLDYLRSKTDVNQYLD